ncbi:MAG TPA: choice-of-anchor tandem repeat GloVer-containing protein [Candidatus Cybelea sp.]
MSYSLLYSFGGVPDGDSPQAGLIGDRHTLYGTTVRGGKYGLGAVFSITRGKEKVLYSLSQGTDGQFPDSGVTDVGGTLYGTTEFGGKFGFGTLFSVTTGGTERVLHSFGHGTDGIFPYGGVIDVNGTLYGTTFEGGTYPCASGATCGTVYSFTPGRAEKVLHSFGKGTDGSFPFAGLIDVSGTLYGTTSAGGAHPCNFSGSTTCGTVFSITTGGKERVLHSFGKGTDGYFPFASLTAVNGVLYGTTAGGGSNHCGKCGTVFSITPGGAERVLHSFGKNTDGSDPGASLVGVGGTLYGTTYEGGAHSAGTVFSVATDGTEKILHSFGSGTDGTNPDGGLNYKGGRLVGTTVKGGVSSRGTVFLLTP